MSIRGKAPDKQAGLQAHELALYTDAYKQRTSQEEVFRGSLSAW